ncbi:type II toxin-antitoxin system RelB/DinJ family antitoxin [Pantoea endophytica]|uniref:Type II toxin-antitoxin system RelB/DinJ family antitoxin n=1 Tax=Pantoea sp. BJ2 TaxID=3141322 RepID=A0AAU7U3Y1_9GAMM
MTTTQANFRIDADIKDQAEQTFILLGVTPSQAVNHFYQYVAEKGRLPFSVQTTVTLENDEDIYLRLLREIRICNMHLRYAELLSEKGDKPASLNKALSLAKSEASRAYDTLDEHMSSVAQYAHSLQEFGANHETGGVDQFLVQLRDRLWNIRLCPASDSTQIVSMHRDLYTSALILTFSHPTECDEDILECPHYVPDSYMVGGQ